MWLWGKNISPETPCAVVLGPSEQALGLVDRSLPSSSLQGCWQEAETRHVHGMGLPLP